MHMKLTLLRGFQVVGEGTLTLYPQIVDVLSIPKAETIARKKVQTEQIAKWMLAVEQAVNANGPLRMHLEVIDNETTTNKELAA